MPALGKHHNDESKMLDVYGINVQKFNFDSRDGSLEALTAALPNELQIYENALIGTPERPGYPYIGSELNKSREGA